MTKGKVLWFARIRIKNYRDEVLVNNYADNEPVALQLTGIDFRLGLKFIFP